RRHTRSDRDWSSDVCSSDLADTGAFSQVPFPFVVFSREPPVLSSVDVSGAPPGATFRMTLSGGHLALAQISFSGNGITVVPSSKIGRASCRERGGWTVSADW